MYARVDFFLQDENRLLEMKILERLDALQEMMMGRVAEAPPQEEEGVTEKVQNCRLVATVYIAST